jgi:hypothetical protein
VSSLLDKRNVPKATAPVLKVSRLTTSVASLGDTGLVGQVKGLVGLSTYNKIKEALARYYQAKLPLDRQKQLVQITALIAQWMSANRSSTTKGNLARMKKLHALDAEVLHELASPAATSATAAAVTSTPWVKATPTLPTESTAQRPSTLPQAADVTPTPSLEGTPVHTDEPAAPTGQQGLVINPARVKALIQVLRDLIAQSQSTPQVARKVALTKQIQFEIGQLLPMLTDPRLAKIHRAIYDYNRTLREALPALEEQAEYMNDVVTRGDRLAFLSGQGAIAVSQAIQLAQGITDANVAGVGSEALKIMQERGITDAEMAAIKIYTAADYRYINAGIAKDRGGWLRSAIVNLQDKPSTAPETLGAPLGPGQQGPLSKGDAIAASEGARHARMALEGLRKMKPWAGGVPTFRGMGLSHEEYKQQFEDTSTWTSAAFTSTSVDKTVSEQFARSESQGGKQGILIVFDVVIDGRDLMDISIFGREGEVLLLPGATADITRIDDDPTDPNTKVVHLRQTK